MKKSRYFVVFDQDGWKIQCDGENSETYESRSEAVRDAVALAYLDDRNGRDSDVIVQSRNGFSPEWDSRRDAYPPPLVPEM
jgi:hypothetical protein